MSRIKSLATDTMIYGSFTIIGRFLTFLLTPVYANFLLMQEVGNISNLFSIIAFLNIIYTFGMESAFFRFYSQDNFAQSKKVFSVAYFTILSIALLISTIAIFSAPVIAPYFFDNPDSVKLIRLAALIPLLDCMLVIPMALLRMTRRAKRFALTRFLMIIAAVSLNILFIVGFNWGAAGVIYAQLISSIFGITLLFSEIYKYLLVRIDRSLLINMLKYGIPAMPAALSGMILQVANIPLLKMITEDSRTVAMYSINYKLAVPMMLFVSIFEYAWKPFYMTHFRDNDAKLLFSRIFTYFTLAAALMFLTVSYFMEYIVMIPFSDGELIKSVYWSGMGIIPFVLIGFYFNGVYNNFAAGLHIRKKTKYLPIAIGIAAASNIILNILLIPFYGIWGSVSASAISYFLSAVIIYFYSRKIYPITYQWKRILLLISLTALFYLVAEYITNGIDIVLGITVKFIFLLGFILTLFISKFFNKAELKTFFTVFKRKHT